MAAGNPSQKDVMPQITESPLFMDFVATIQSVARVGQSLGEV